MAITTERIFKDRIKGHTRALALKDVTSMQDSGNFHHGSVLLQTRAFATRFCDIYNLLKSLGLRLNLTDPFQRFIFNLLVN